VDTCFGQSLKKKIIHQVLTQVIFHIKAKT